MVNNFVHRKKETEPAAAKKLPAVPESVLKRKKTREAVRAARLQISIKVAFGTVLYIFLLNECFKLVEMIK